MEILTVLGAILASIWVLETVILLTLILVDRARSDAAPPPGG